MEAQSAAVTAEVAQEETYTLLADPTSPVGYIAVFADGSWAPYVPLGATVA